ncbi:MAG: NAD(P)H-binding protein [Candidatus Sumerlaeales bacterium]|nr:NAD(P)H-binding protein [Candidatus Sumerlaeales bacterium]
MIILVTGGSGHTGSRLVRQLLSDGHRVFVLSRTPSKLSSFGNSITIVRGDLTSPAEDYTGQIDAPLDAIVAMTHIRFAERVIDLAHRVGCRRVVCMSSTRRFTRFPEETARAVIAGEGALEQSDLDYTIIRPTMIYGGDTDNNLTHLVRALGRYPIHPLPDGGRMLWQPIYTWDVVHAVTGALARRESTSRKSFTVAGPKALSYREIVETILNEMGRRRRVLLVPVPIGFVDGLCGLWTRISGRRAVLTPDQIARLREDKAFDARPSIEALGYSPTEFVDGIRAKLRGEA